MCKFASEYVDNVKITDLMSSVSISYLATISFSLTEAMALPPADVLDPTKYSRWAAKYFSTNGSTT